MTNSGPLPVVPTPPTDPRDAAAATLLDTYASGELARVRKSADRWTTGLAALVGVISTAVVVKGPDSFKDLEEKAQWAVAVLMLVGGVALGVGIFKAYRASTGSPTARSGLDTLAGSPHQVAGLAAKWQNAVKALIEESRNELSRATKATLVGVVLLVVALGLAWFGPTDSDDVPSTCISTTGGVTTIDGPAPTVTSGSLEIVACPKSSPSKAPASDQPPQPSSAPTSVSPTPP